MWNLLYGVILAGAIMYIFSSIVADKVARKVIKELSDLIEDKMDI